MKILVLSNLYPPDVLGGYEIACKQAVDGLRARGHEVRVLTATPRRPVPSEPHVIRQFQLTDIWYNASRLQSHPAVNQVWDIDASCISSHNVHVLLQELDSFQPDAVYVWMVTGIGGLGLIGCLQYRKIPWVWHLMDEVPALLCSYNWNLVPELARHFGRFVSGRYLSCSRAMIVRMQDRGVDLSGEVDILPGWVVGDRPRPRTTFYRSGRLKIVSAGRVTLDKGIDRVVETAMILRDRGIDDFQIDVYGPIVERSIPSLVQKYQLEDHVRFMGRRPQSEMSSIFAESDLFVFPTEAREPFGLAPLEAAAQGCVPLISHACGIAERLVHGVHCLKSVRNAESFADAIAAIIRGEIDLAPIGRRGQAVVWRDFHLDALIPRIERALGQVATGPREDAGSSDEAYRMAIMAERLSHAIVQEPFCA